MVESYVRKTHETREGDKNYESSVLGFHAQEEGLDLATLLEAHLE